MSDKLIEHVANRTVRVVSADWHYHHFILSWKGEVCNIVWENAFNGVSSINGVGVDLLLETEELSEEELEILENVLRNHLINLDN